MIWYSFWCNYLRKVFRYFLFAYKTNEHMNFIGLFGILKLTMFSLHSFITRILNASSTVITLVIITIVQKLPWQFCKNVSDSPQNNMFFPVGWYRIMIFFYSLHNKMYSYDFTIICWYCRKKHYFDIIHNIHNENSNGFFLNGFWFGFNCSSNEF